MKDIELITSKLTKPNICPRCFGELSEVYSGEGTGLTDDKSEYYETFECEDCGWSCGHWYEYRESDYFEEQEDWRDDLDD